MVSIRFWKLRQLIPIACFDIALCNVFLVAWLWLGKGIMDAHTPNIIDGCNSQCVYFRFSSNKFKGSIAIRALYSSSISTYSATPFLIKFSKVTPCTKSEGLNTNWLFFTISKGRIGLPESVNSLISFWVKSSTIDTSSEIVPVLLSSTSHYLSLWGFEV